MRESDGIAEQIGRQQLRHKQMSDDRSVALRSLCARLKCSHVATSTLMPSGTFQAMAIESLDPTATIVVRSQDPFGHFVEAMNWSCLHHGKAITMETESVDHFTARGIDAVATAPLHDPVLSGYPGVLQAFRSTGAGPFSEYDLRLLTNVADSFHEADADQRRDGGSLQRVAAVSDGCCIVLTAEGRPWFHSNGVSEMSARVRAQLIERSRLLAGDTIAPSVGRRDLLLPDERGVNHVVKAVPLHGVAVPHDGQLSHPPLMLFCFMPSADQYLALTIEQFGSNDEVARMIPALQFMAGDISKVPGLKEIAETAHLSPFHFHRRFSDVLGLTPKHFLLSVQIAHAQRMLAQGSSVLSEIADACGFAHQSHFTSRFKQATGLTPSKWRRIVT